MTSMDSKQHQSLYCSQVAKLPNYLCRKSDYNIYKLVSKKDCSFIESAFRSNLSKSAENTQAIYVTHRRTSLVWPRFMGASKLKKGKLHGVSVKLGVRVNNKKKTGG